MLSTPLREFSKASDITDVLDEIIDYIFQPLLGNSLKLLQRR